jgi:TP901 family phage tail tape measure protein
MATLTSQLIVSLIDRVTSPARGVAATVERLQDAQRRNNAQMDEMRGRMVDAAAMAYALARAVGSPVQVAADFETAMNRVTALSGATGEQFDQLRQQALELGRTTQYTASQAGDAMGFLAMAGFDANQILGAMPGTLQLAAAAQMDLASTADLVSNVLSGYQLDVSELGRVNDVLVKTFTSSNTSLSQLGEAMSYAAPIAATMGMNFETAAAAIGIMGNAGIQGSRAGTGLNAILSGLAKPSDPAWQTMQKLGIEVMDAAGNMRSMTDILADFERGFGDLADVVLDSEGQLLDFEEAAEALAGSGERGAAMLQLFGRRGGPSFAALLGLGSDALRDFEAVLADSGGTAERIANVQMAGFNGKMREFHSAIEGLQIAIGTALLPSLTAIVGQITALVAPITAFAEANPELTSTVIALAGGLVAFRVAAVAAQFAMLWMKGGAISAAILSMRALQGSLLLTRLAFLPFTAGLRAARRAMLGYSAAVAIAGHGGALALVGRSMLALLSPIRILRGALFGLRVALISTGIGAVIVGIAAAGAWIYQNWAGIGEMFAGIAEGIRESFPAAGAIIDGISDSVAALAGWFGDLTGPIDASAEEWRGWGKAIGQSVGRVLQDVAELPGRIASALIAGGAAIYDAGVALIQSFWDGIVAKFDELLAWFRELPSRIIAAIGSIDLTGIIRWPSMPSWLGGGGEAAVAGARAAGGPIAKGRAYLVGEEGPEIITAGADGYVHDARASRDMMQRGGGKGTRGAGVSNVFNVTFGPINGVTDPKAFMREAYEELNRLQRQELSGLQADVEWGVA